MVHGCFILSLARFGDTSDRLRKWLCPHTSGARAFGGLSVCMSISVAVMARQKLGSSAQARPIVIGSAIGIGLGSLDLLG